MFCFSPWIILFIYWIRSGTNASSECDHVKLSSTLHQLASNHTHITRLVSIGKSVEGRDLWLMILSDSPALRPLLRPQVKFLGNINGYSGPACYVLLRLIQELVAGYEIEGSLERRLLQRNEIHVLVNMNPDGYARAKPAECNAPNGRLNKNGMNLNRDFPYIFEEDDRTKREPETEAVMRWMHENHFVLSLSLISGALVVTYPFDSIPLQEGMETVAYAHVTPDDEIFTHLAHTYVEHAQGDAWYCPNLERYFPGGIINGADWQPARGTMMDYNYVNGTFELMIGVSCCRNPTDEHLPQIWEQHRHALMSIVLETETGVRGQVMDAKTLEVLSNAELFMIEQGLPFSDRGPPSVTSTQGEFWKPLKPRKYSLIIQKEGYKETTVLFEVSLKEGTELTVKLDKLLQTDPGILNASAGKLDNYSAHHATTDATNKKLSREDPDQMGVDLATTAKKFESRTEVVQRLNVSSSKIFEVAYQPPRLPRSFEETLVSMVVERLNVSSSELFEVSSEPPKSSRTFDETLVSMVARLRSSSPLITVDWRFVSLTSFLLASL